MDTSQESSLLEDYQASLNELDSNCKIKINGLTMVAEENKEHAVAIASCIENQLKKVPKHCKLYVLHLIDSICKNFPKSMYVQLFTQNLVSNFCNVFEVSDEKTRRSLHKLRMSWSKTKLFPAKKLNAIDRRVHEMDPNWPILNKLTPNVNNNNNHNSSNNNNNNNINNPALAPTNSLQRQQQIQQQQLIKQQQLQQQQSQQQHHQQQSLPHQQQQPAHHIQPFDIMPSQQYIATPMMFQVAPFQVLQTQPIPQADQILVNPYDQAIVAPQPQSQPPPPPMPILQTVTAVTEPTATQTGVVPLPTAGPQQQPVVVIPQPSQVIISQNPMEAQNQSQSEKPQTQNTVLNSLYGGKQCSNCSLRFDDNNRYAIHLDWHFRQNLKTDHMFARRKWYYPLDLWVQFREINDDDLQENNNDNNNVNDMLVQVNENEVPTAPASKDDEKNICSVCHETFEKFWAEEEEEWQLKNAKLYELYDRVYHPLCLMDMLQANANESVAAVDTSS